MTEDRIASVILVTYLVMWFVGVVALTIGWGLLTSVVLGFASVVFGLWLATWGSPSLLAAILSGILGAAIGVWLIK